tara:strand:- start:107 stop:526 length:420 start_codon:yes stop_codon:yes gene_type:complete
MIDGISWVPRKAVFMRRAATTAGITFTTLLTLGFALSAYVGVSALWVIPFAVLLTLGFVFDDIMRWRAAKFDRWQIDQGHLVHEGGEGIARVPLTDISRVFTRIGGNVVVQLWSGQRIAMRFLPHPEKTAQAINAARPA